MADSDGGLRRNDNFLAHGPDIGHVLAYPDLVRLIFS